MDLLLRLLNTGKTYHVRGSSLVPRMEPQKLGVLYAVPGAWCLSPVAPHPGLLHNGLPLAQGCVLAVGDELHTGEERWKVERIEPPEPVASAAPQPPRCRVTVLGGAQIVADGELIIGSAEHCDLVLPAEAGVQPLHALLSPLGGHWTLHALSSSGLDDPEQGRVKSLVIESGARVLLGQARLVFGFVSDADTKLPEPAETSVTVESNYGSDLPPDAPDALLLAEALASTDPILSRCGDILHALLTDRLLPAPVSPPSLLGRLTGLVNWSKETDDDTLNRLQNELANQPRGRDAWLKFARFLEAHEHLDLCRIVLEQMVGRQLANDAAVVALIRLYLVLGRDRDRPREERLHYCRRAERLTGRILQRSPGRHEIAELQRTAGTERSIAENDLHEKLS
jgi:hypothetical protein